MGDGGGTGGPHKPILWETIWVIYRDLTFWRLIYTHFKTKEIRITWHHSLQVEFMNEERMQAGEERPSRETGAEHDQARVQIDRKWPKPASNSEKLTNSARETESQALGTCSAGAPEPATVGGKRAGARGRVAKGSTSLLSDKS